jgi:hypothetical protein
VIADVKKRGVERGGNAADRKDSAVVLMLVWSSEPMLYISAFEIMFICAY